MRKRAGGEVISIDRWAWGFFNLFVGRGSCPPIIRSRMERALCPVLIGREEELSELEDALLAANRGEGQVVLLAGDAGMGKTRLSTELMRRARKRGMTVVMGACSEADLALPYLPFLEAIGNHLAAADLDDIRRKLGPVRRELAHLFPQLEPEGVAEVATDQTQGKLPSSST